MGRLEEIEARVQAATPGPWEARYESIFIPADPHPSYLVDDCTNLTEADCAFIAHARADVPWLLAEVRMLESMIGSGH